MRMKLRNAAETSSSKGKFMVLCGILTLVPLLIALGYPTTTSDMMAFIIPGVGSILLGIFCMFHYKPSTSVVPHTQMIKNSSYFVLFAWGYGIIMGALPFLLTHQLTLIQSLHESVSGWTTTGLSTLDVTATSDIFLFHRGFMQYCGGLGFVMVMTLFVQNRFSMNLFQAEGHSDQLMPNLKRTVQVIVFMYTTFLVIGVICYMLAGCNFLDSTVHAMAALSTGGFANHPESIGYYNSPIVEFITIVLMIIGTTNFAALLLLMQRRFKRFWAVSEVRFMFGLLLFIVPLTGLVLFSAAYASMSHSMRVALFEVVSALSTSGFSSVGYGDWPQAASLLLILMMIVGGGIGSTAGGMKMSRVYLMLRSIKDHIMQKISPQESVSLSFYVRPQGKTLIDHKLITDTAVFVFCYILIYFIGTFLLLLTANCTLLEAMFDFASSLGTVGLSMGITNASMPESALLVEIAGMMLGRLEIFIVLIGIRNVFQSIHDSLHAFRLKLFRKEN